MWLGWAGIAINYGFGFSQKLVRATNTLVLTPRRYNHYSNMFFITGFDV